MCTGMQPLRPGSLMHASLQQMASELKVEDDDFRHKKKWLHSSLNKNTLLSNISKHFKIAILLLVLTINWMFWD